MNSEFHHPARGRQDSIPVIEKGGLMEGLVGGISE